MKIKAFIGTTMAAVMIAGCSNEFELTNETLHEGVLKVTVEDNNPVSRVGFDAGGNFYWSKTDYIGVTTSNVTTSFTKLTLQQGGGTASATFSGTIKGTIEGYAIYPYSDKHSINDTQLTFNFPASYTYTKVDQDFFTSTQGDGNSFNPAMVGKITNNSVTLNHLGGVFCIKVSSMPVASGKLTLTADKKINGNFTYNLSNDTFAETTTQSSTTSAGENTVAINFSEATTNSPGVFYIPVPVGEYSNIRIKMYNGSGDTNEEINVAAGTYTIDRKDLKVINLTTGSIDVTAPTIVNDASEVSNSLANKDAVSVSGEITGTSTTINIPTLTEANKTKSLILEKIASNTSLTISESNSGPGNSVENFTLSIPNNDAADFTPLNLNINLPNTTVALAANAGTATFNEVTASTADNTLIIEEGVTVKKLIVNKGNVRVNKGATLTEIAKGDGNTSTVTIYEEEGAKLPDSTGDFVVVDAAIADIEAAASSTEESNSYILQSDITLNRPLVVTAKNFTLDLNGHALKANAGGLDKVLNTSDAVILVRRGATLTINDISNGKGSIDANNVASVYGAVKLTDTNDDTTGDVAKLIVNNGQLKGYYYGIVGNGTRHNTEIIVNGGKIMNTSEEGSGIYHPQEGTLTVTGGEIVGTDTGIELRSGTLNIHGGTVRGTNTTNVTKPNGSGTTISGAALAISQHTTNKNISVTISGGTFEGYYALYEEDLQDDLVSNISIEGISNGVFNGKIYSENCSNFISGGTFSDPEALQFLDTNANVKVQIDADKDCRGFVTKDGQTVELDLQGHKLTLTDPTVGSTGTETNSCQLLKGSKVTFKNGTLLSNNANIVIQNYCTLLLDSMRLETPNSFCSISNNNGSCTLNSTVIKNPVGYAFDVYYWPANGYLDGVTVTVNNSTINGNVDFSGKRASGDTTKKGKLIIKGNSVMNGNLTVTEEFYDSISPNIVIEPSVTFGNGVIGWDSYKKNISE